MRQLSKKIGRATGSISSKKHNSDLERIGAQRMQYIASEEPQKQVNKQKRKPTWYC